MSRTTQVYIMLVVYALMLLALTFGTDGVWFHIYARLCAAWGCLCVLNICRWIHGVGK
jgi:hypothetical protein